MASPIALVAFLLVSAAALAQTAPLAVTHVTVIDATGGAPRPDVTVLVSDGRVAAVGREVPIPEKPRLSKALASF